MCMHALVAHLVKRWTPKQDLHLDPLIALHPTRYNLATASRGMTENSRTAQTSSAIYIDLWRYQAVQIQRRLGDVWKNPFELASPR